MKKIHPATLGLDFDGVIGDIGEAFLRVACTQHGYCDIDINAITNFTVEGCTVIPSETVIQIFIDIMEDSLGTGLKPLPGAMQALQQFAKEGRVTIITARTIKEPVALWLEHFLDPETCSKIDIIAMSDHDNKVNFCKERGLTHFMDDRGETCQQMQDAGILPILFRQPWNLRFENFITVNNWQEVLKLTDIPTPAPLRN